MIRWLLVVVLIFLAGVGGYLYLMRYEAVEREVGTQAPESLESILKSQVYENKGFSEAVVIRDSEFGYYYIRGIVDGVAYEELIDLNKPNGKRWGTSLLAYKLIYLDSEDNLRGILLPLLVENTDNEVMVLDDSGYVGLVEEYGEDASIEQMKDYFKHFYEGKRGRVVTAVFSASPQDIDVLLSKHAENGYPVDMSSYIGRRFEWVKSYLTGNEGVYAGFVQTGRGLDYLVFDRNGSEFYMTNPVMVFIPEGITIEVL